MASLFSWLPWKTKRSNTSNLSYCPSFNSSKGSNKSKKSSTSLGSCWSDFTSNDCDRYVEVPQHDGSDQESPFNIAVINKNGPMVLYEPTRNMKMKRSASNDGFITLGVGNLVEKYEMESFVMPIKDTTPNSPMTTDQYNETAAFSKDKHRVEPLVDKYEMEALIMPINDATPEFPVKINKFKMESFDESEDHSLLEMEPLAGREDNIPLNMQSIGQGKNGPFLGEKKKPLAGGEEYVPLDMKPLAGGEDDIPYDQLEEIIVENERDNNTAEIEPEIEITPNVKIIYYGKKKRNDKKENSVAKERRSGKKENSLEKRAVKDKKENFEDTMPIAKAEKDTNVSIAKIKKNMTLPIKELCEPEIEITPKVKINKKRAVKDKKEDSVLLMPVAKAKKDTHVPVAKAKKDTQVPVAKAKKDTHVPVAKAKMGTHVPVAQIENNMTLPIKDLTMPIAKAEKDKSVSIAKIKKNMTLPIKELMGAHANDNQNKRAVEDKNEDSVLPMPVAKAKKNKEVAMPPPTKVLITKSFVWDEKRKTAVVKPLLLARESIPPRVYTSGSICLKCKEKEAKYRKYYGRVLFLEKVRRICEKKELLHKRRYAGIPARVVRPCSPLKAEEIPAEKEVTETTNAKDENLDAAQSSKLE